MKRYLLNFHKSAKDRAAEISTRAYNHYLRIKPVLSRMYRPIKQFRQGKNSTGRKDI